MKKLLVVLLATVLVLGMATSAYAYTDTSSLSTAQQDAIYRLSALDVLNGYTDGTFGPDKSVTRAEFAKIACELAGLGDVADTLKSTPSSFSDVAVNQWYTGYVNIAASQGYINGYSDGTFKPNKTISMAEVVTILMRIAGYDDNLPGPWPFDYISEAGKQDVTDDVTFVSNTPATRASVAVMANNLLDVTEVDWNSDTSKFEDVKKGNDVVTVLDDSFSASVYDDAVFDNDAKKDDATDCWSVKKLANVTKADISDADDDAIQVTFYPYDDDNDKYLAKVTDKMDPACYIAGGLSLTDLSGMIADVITNDDDEVIYVKVTSSVEYSDDVSGSLEKDDVEVNDKDVKAVDNLDLIPWYDKNNFATAAISGYAKVFKNEDGDAYAVEDLYSKMGDKDELSDSDLVYGAPVYIADSYASDELKTLDSSNDKIDLSDYDVVAYKDGKFIDPTTIAQKDVVSIIPANGDADYMLLVTPLVEATLSDGTDTIKTGSSAGPGWVNVNDGKSWYYFGVDEFTGTLGSGVSQLIARYNLDGVTDDGYADLTDTNQLDDAYGQTVEIAPYRTYFDMAYIATVATDGNSNDVYGLVTDFDSSSVTGKITSITVMNQTGKEVTYDVDNGDDILYYHKDGGGNEQDSTIKASYVQMGNYIEASLNKDGQIDDVDHIWNYHAYGAGNTYGVNNLTGKMDVSGTKIKINGTWYKFDKNTLFFEMDTVSTALTIGSFTSANYDDSSLLSYDNVYASDDITADAFIIADKDGSTINRVIFVNSDMSSGTGTISFVNKTYTNADDKYVKFVDGTTGIQKSIVLGTNDGYSKNVLYAYDKDGDKIKTTKMWDLTTLPANQTITACPAGDTDLYWVLNTGASTNAAPDPLSPTAKHYSDVISKVLDIDKGSLEIGSGATMQYYDETDKTVYYEINNSGNAETSLASSGDIDEGDYVIAICDEDGNLVYVILIDDLSAITGGASVTSSDSSIPVAQLDGYTVTLTLHNSLFDSTLSDTSFTVDATGLTGLSVATNGVTRTSDTTATVKLKYTGSTSITSDGSFKLTVASKELSTSKDLPTSSITVVATDTTNPIISTGYPKAGTAQTNGSKKVEVLVKANEAGTAYYVVVANNATAPSAAQVMAGQDSTGAAAFNAGSGSISANTEKSFITAALAADATDYDVYAVVKDASGNNSIAVKGDIITPAAADVTPPSSPTYSPAAGATTVAVNVTPTLTFTEALYSNSTGTAMSATPTGVIKVYEGTSSAGTALTEGTGAATNQYFTVAYNSTTHVFTITFGANMKAGQDYYVELQANKVYDAAGNAIGTAQGVTFKTTP